MYRTQEDKESQEISRRDAWIGVDEGVGVKIETSVAVRVGMECSTVVTV